ITDTHFSARSRLGRLIAFVARLNQIASSEKIVGIGVDEKTALLIDANGIGRLASGSAGSAWLVQQTEPATSLVAGQALSLANERVTELDAGSSINMRTHQVGAPASTTLLSIVNGQPSQPSRLDRMLMRGPVPAGED
ncbi:MAG: hypothetical protein ABI451_09350, partial [Dokdonella sp.]